MFNIYTHVFSFCAQQRGLSLLSSYKDTNKSTVLKQSQMIGTLGNMATVYSGRSVVNVMHGSRVFFKYDSFFFKRTRPFFLLSYTWRCELKTDESIRGNS